MNYPLRPFRARTHRLIASRWPTVGVFDDVVSPEDVRAAYELEAATNDRVADTLRRLSAIPEPEWAMGNEGGATLAMAAFLHPSLTGGRFNGPDLGAWYAALDLSTAIAETVFHHEWRLRASAGAFPCHIQMRELVTSPKVSLLDVRGDERLHRPHDYSKSQRFGEETRRSGLDGIWYGSVRRAGGENVVVFKPRRLIPISQGDHFGYAWDKEGNLEIAKLTSVAAGS